MHNLKATITRLLPPGLGLAVSIFIIFLAASGASAGQRPEGALIVDVEGFASSEGMAGIALFNKPEDYEAKQPVYRWAWSVIMELKAGWVIQRLPYGEYAITVYHDRNSNHRMDMVLGIPQEAYGYSNNPLHGPGAPSWRTVRVVLDQPVKHLTIRISGGQPER